MTALIASAAREIDAVTSRPVAEIEATLDRVAVALATLPSFASKCPKEGRDRLRSQVAYLKDRMARLDRVMERSAELFSGYVRGSASSQKEYTPRGFASAGRDPVFVSLSM